MARTDAVIAANRFGFGARPGELDRLGSTARDALRNRLSCGDCTMAAGLAPSHELLARVSAQLAGRREARGNGQMGAGAAPSAVAAAAVLRDVYLPAYVAEVRERFLAAVASEHSLQERLVHFWSNHFAVSVDKLVVLGLAGAMEREAIRPHVFGRFADMLLAVEKHPAMLLYLDNQLSTGPRSRAARFARRRGRDLGLNENLGREILELHTLGVDGPYGQQDVQSLARIITGWSIGGVAGRLHGGEPGRFHFREVLHEPGEQQLLGRRYRDEGVGQGEAALRDLAWHPATATHLATKLARHFIADDPPAAAVARIARAYQESDGDLPAVYRALIDLPEGWATPQMKFKTPIEFVISTYRLLDLAVPEGAAAARIFEDLGQRHFQPGSPAGWPDRSADWDGSAALFRRLEWAQQIAQAHGSSQRAEQLARAAWAGDPDSASVRAIFRAQDQVQGLTLVLCSPEFMRR